jgi:membrane-associated phospholipid phosphatase
MDVRLGKALYGAAFVLFLPALLTAWAILTRDAVPLPPPQVPWLGWVLVLSGAALMASGMAALWIHGGGLPMNAFPPPRYVSGGIYGWTAHPIYVGFSATAGGAALLCGSPSGFWLVSPVVMLGSVALVLGYERHDLRARFGQSLPRPRLSIPAPDASRPGPWDRLSVYVLALTPWLIVYLLLRPLAPPDAVSGYLPFESRWGVIQWAEAFYSTPYLVVAAVPLAAALRADLRRFSLQVLLAMAISFPLFLAIPLVAAPRPFVPQTSWGRLLAWERSIDTAGEAFPSFHVILAVLAAEALAARAPRLRWLWRGWAAAVALSCLATGMHSIADVAAGLAVAALVLRAETVWEWLRRSSERIANSWREWRLGPVRVINHGFYAGAGALAAVAITCTLGGPASSALMLVVAACALVAAGLWAQYIEGSPQLLRPYGFYGGVVGVALGSAAAPLFGLSPWLPLAAYSVAGPWVQSLGRLRCLVQGCCHGSPAPEQIGIRYWHARSRVCRLTDWRGVPLHPAPLYSILWNVLVAAAALRLWSLNARLSLIAGLYLILTGLGRFVEEAYRGEPQTPVFARLRLYQWVAAATVLGGILLTCAPAAPAAAPHWHWATLGYGAGFGLITTLALGVDFPESNRRFSRLA